MPPPVRRHIVSIPVGPEAVTHAREAVAGRFREIGVVPDSTFADAVLLVVSELVTNALRHAARSPLMDVGITVAADQLVVSVADAEPRLPDLTLEGMGAGLRMVTELAADYDGDVSAEPALDHDGKVVLVRFQIPSQVM
ncbi:MULTISPECIES: ATP-binding protein [unclassified Streptomyces]|uniref:ATP-binding protein n=1 Tax=unclassified Streptomyces TaxID=2593676 RepID=UPI0023658438|nr:MULTISPECIES: ATP-binding protein [unclassified Streptomyces]MDF3143487.1 ATP-binding protein [Streptomyces sp. T21Q-yed]WDF44042.1 ATP-binding protein [Streptomyces sp. T12]